MATREIFLHSYLGAETEEPGVDYRMTAVFIKNLRLLDQKGKSILIHMSTVGGSYPDGMAIYDAIKTAESHITILAYTAARSMSSIVLQAADFRVLMPHADMMLHEGTMAAECSSRLFQTHARQDRLALDAMLDVYAGACYGSKFFAGRNRNVIRKHIKREYDRQQDWWLSSTAAVDYGLADAVLGDKNAKTIDKLTH